MGKPLTEYVEPEAGQTYNHSRLDFVFQILYVDDEIVLLRSERERRDGGNEHRLERRATFEDYIESGRYEYNPDAGVDFINDAERDWSDVSGIGEQTNENLHDAGFVTALDIQRASDDELLDVDGLGETTVQRLREHAR